MLPFRANVVLLDHPPPSAFCTVGAACCSCDNEGGREGLAGLEPAYQGGRLRGSRCLYQRRCNSTITHLLPVRREGHSADIAVETFRHAASRAAALAHHRGQCMANVDVLRLLQWRCRTWGRPQLRGCRGGEGSGQQRQRCEKRRMRVDKMAQ